MTSDRRRERGASLIETALVVPVLLTLFFGIFEAGLMLRAELTLSNAARDAGRSASAYARSPQADYLTLRVLNHSLTPVGLEGLDYVVIFEAAGPESTMPAGCATQSIAGVCNRYTATDFFKPLEDAAGADAGNFRCTATAVDRHWCPTDREASLSGGVDYIGIHIEMEHDLVTDFFGSTITLTDTIVFRMEVETL